MWKDGKVFSHWNTMANGSGSSYEPGDRVTLAMSSFTLYAQWEDPECTLRIACSSVNESSMISVRTEDKYGFRHLCAPNAAINVVCTPGKDIFLERSGFAKWYINTGSKSEAVDCCTAFRIKVPANATGLATFRVQNNQYSTILSETFGWVSNGISINPFGGTITLGTASNAATGNDDYYFGIKVKDPYGYSHFYTANNRSEYWIQSKYRRAFPGCEISFYVITSPSSGASLGMCTGGDFYICHGFNDEVGKTMIGHLETTTDGVFVVTGIVPSDATESPYGFPRAEWLGSSYSAVRLNMWFSGGLNYWYPENMSIRKIDDIDSVLIP